MITKEMRSAMGAGVAFLHFSITHRHVHIYVHMYVLHTYVHRSHSFHNNDNARYGH